MGCNNDFETRGVRNNDFETRGVRNNDFETRFGRNRRRNCGRLANDIERIIDDIIEDAERLDDRFDELRREGCIRHRNSWDDSDNWDDWNNWNRNRRSCNRCCNRCCNRW